MRAFMFTPRSDSTWPHFRLVVFAATPGAAKTYVKNAAISSHAHRGLQYVGEGQPAEKERDRWVAATVR